MANYATLQAAIDAGITNMTVLRDNTKNDDGTTTYATGMDWFKFNNVVVSNIYSSGNSWIGLGASSEQLKVNRRDCAVWYEYSETGIIGRCRFYKFRWRGYSAYNSTAETALQEFEFYLLDSGQIFLRFFTVPTSNFNGTNSLVCGSQTVSYSVSAGTPCEYTFTPSDPSTGTEWSVATNRPVVNDYKTSGSAIFTLADYIVGANDTLTWTAETPTGTSVAFSTSINNGAWQSVTNGGLMAGMPAKGTTCNLRIKAVLSTTDTARTPSVTEIKVTSDGDKKVLTLTPNIPNISSAIGNATVLYNGLGGLQGDGGPVEAFEGTFIPSGLTWKGHQNDEEHIEVSAAATVTLSLITFADTQEAEHIEVSAAATVTLTDIHDI